MAKALFRHGIVAAALAVAAIGTPAAAQLFSEGYEFLKAVKDRDGEKVTAALNEPGTTVVNSRDLTSGETALHIVTRRRDSLWITFLTSRGANPNIADKDGVTPLQLAASLGFIEGLEKLIAAGARVDVTNSAGETPLMSAVHRRDIAMVRLLLDKGADVDRKDNSGRSARDYAMLMGSGQLTDAIEEADKKKKDKAGASYGPSF